jgi:hypothetical protein
VSSNHGYGNEDIEARRRLVVVVKGEYRCIRPRRRKLVPPSGLSALDVFFSALVTGARRSERGRRSLTGLRRGTIYPS